MKHHYSMIIILKETIFLCRRTNSMLDYLLAILNLKFMDLIILMKYSQPLKSLPVSYLK